MSHMHRIQWFDQQIRAGTFPNSGQLAERFEISRRQAQRDIEYMEVSLRAPLQYVARHRGYRYEDDSFVLPHLYITEDENRVLKYLAHRYRAYNYENREDIRRIGELLERFTDEGEGELLEALPAFKVNPRHMQYIELLDHAIRERSVVRLLYAFPQQGSPDEVREITLCPLRLVFSYGEDQLLARLEGEAAATSYSLERMQQLEVTAHVFAAEAEGDSRVYSGLRQQLKPFQAKLRLSEDSQQPVIFSWKGYATRHLQDDVYEIEFFDVDQLVTQLLASDWTELLEPSWLQKKVADRCRKVLERLQGRGE